MNCIPIRLRHWRSACEGESPPTNPLTCLLAGDNFRYRRLPQCTVTVSEREHFAPCVGRRIADILPAFCKNVQRVQVRFYYSNGHLQVADDKRRLLAN